ncbi:MAG: protein-L-isoaspartate(D-aspartate) O-methyltransferase [Planctomycetaceae bacterium]
MPPQTELGSRPSYPGVVRRPASAPHWGHRLTLVLFASLGLMEIGSGNVWGQTKEKDKYAPLRDKMVTVCLEREGIQNQRVLDWMRQVPRHLFVPANLRHAAYFDQALPIGQKQTISPPYIVAYMTESLDPQPEDRVLEIGTGSGYQAAVLSGLVKDVYTIEIVEPLGKTAAKVLTDLKYENVHTRIGDGYLGWPEAAPFDKIIVTCSPEDIPQPLVDQLREGGRMIIPIGERYDQAFYLLEKKGGQLERRKLLPVLFVPMTGDSEAQRKIQPDPGKPQLRNGGFELANDGIAENWYYQRGLTRQTEGAVEGEACVVFENDEPGRGTQMLQGMAVDGSKISGLNFSLRVRGRDLRSGTHADERPALRIHFYDADRKELPIDGVGPWEGTFDWKRVSKLVPVPSRAREAILRIGLNGGLGELAVDDVQMKVLPRQ